MSRKLLVTSALPYANGPIHLGHLVEYIQTDIWVRFQKMRGHTCHYVCADDAHGTPIMLRAQNEGRSPEALIADMSAAHQADFADFLIDFDHYHSTHSAENQALSERIYLANQAAGHITTRTIEQAYDPEKAMFLPDRFIKGQCPKCHAPDQYGDNCEVCGATYSPTDLLNPVSAISGATPISKASEHYFFKLADFTDLLTHWIQQEDHLQPAVRHKLQEWLATGLKDWDISRDAPYFGFAIPGSRDKYFYVWLDAPIGYLASFQAYCQQHQLDFESYLAPDSDTELVHFIGKDIIYFHALFWPAILHGAGLKLPQHIYAHGFLTVNGKKMSKSRGTFITARSYLEQLSPEYLRYYFAAKLGSGIDDIDLNLADFQSRINADLVGKVVNIASRCAGFIQQHFAGQLADHLADANLFNDFISQQQSIAEQYEGREFASAMRDIMALADKANQYIAEEKPWVLIKQTDQHATVQAICTMGINLFRVLMTYLKPVLPALAEQAEAFLKIPPLSWQTIDSPLLAHSIAPYQPLMTRIDPKKIAALQKASQSAGQSATPKATPNTGSKTENKEVVTIADFAKLDLRIAKIIAANHVKAADKLLQLQLDIGDQQRQVFAGIKSHYQPADLIGRYTLMVANLAPRKMRFGVSEGMVLAASNDKGGLFLLSPDSGAEAGMQVK